MKITDLRIGDRVQEKGKNFPFIVTGLFGDKDVVLSDARYQRMIRHEITHTKQMKELLYLPFYVWYLLEWLVRLVMYRDRHKAYRNISFEREAYANQHKWDYNKGRKRYAFIKYFLKKS